MPKVFIFYNWTHTVRPVSYTHLDVYKRQIKQYMQDNTTKGPEGQGESDQRTKGGRTED